MADCIVKRRDNIKRYCKKEGVCMRKEDSTRDGEVTIEKKKILQG